MPNAGANGYREGCKWLRGVDLNHRPLGYENLVPSPKVVRRNSEGTSLHPGHGRSLAIHFAIRSMGNFVLVGVCFASIAGPTIHLHEVHHA